MAKHEDYLVAVVPTMFETTPSTDRSRCDTVPQIHVSYSNLGTPGALYIDLRNILDIVGQINRLVLVTFNEIMLSRITKVVLDNSTVLSQTEQLSLPWGEQLAVVASEGASDHGHSVAF